MTTIIKKYKIFIYDKDGNNPRSINSNDVLNDISFSQNINGGQGNFDLQLNKSYDNDEYLQGDVIEIREYDTVNNQSGISIYTGNIQDIRRSNKKNSEFITLQCQGIFNLLSDLRFDNGGKTFTIKDDPGNIIKTIIDYFNTIYLWSGDSKNLGATIISYAGGNVDTFGSDIDIEFNYTSCYDSIVKVAEKIQYWFYIDSHGEVFFKPKPTTPTHKLKFKQSVNDIDSNETKKEIANKIYVERAGGVIKMYEDVPSQVKYGLKEPDLIVKSDIQDDTTQNDFGDSFIEENKEIKKDTTVELNPLYNFESIVPGQSIRIGNITKPIENLQVVRMTYRPGGVILYLDRYLSLGEVINSQ